MDKDAENIKRLEAASVYTFIKNHQIKNETGELLDFKKYRFMYDIYWDTSRLICCLKAAQIGFTTYQIIKSAHECKYEGIDIVYVFPTDADVKTFSSGKTNKILAQNPIMGQWTKDKDSTEQKMFGKNTIYYRGSWTDRAALSFTAKKLIVDEYDRCKQDIIAQYDTRLQSVAEPKKAFFSNPSSPGFGVHKFFLQSDQKKWHITHSCGKTYIMDEKCINFDKETYQCPFCSVTINDEERRLGEWIATSEGEWSGYWIPLWIAPWIPAKFICKAKRDRSPEQFDNFVAGLPHVGSGNNVTADTIKQNLNPKVNEQEDRIIIGVDTGLPIHYVIGNKQGIFFYGTCTGYDVLEGYLKRWPRSIIVSDQGGDLIGIRNLREKYPGRVFLCYYRQDRKTNEIINWGEGDKYGEVVVDRNRGLQMLIDELNDKRFPINGTESDWHEYITHWLNIYRVWEENNLGQQVFKWERSGADHYVHATLYFRVGIDKYAESMAKVASKNDFLKKIPQGRNFNIETTYETNHYTLDF